MYRSLYQLLLITIVPLLLLFSCSNTSNEPLDGSSRENFRLFDLLEPDESGVTFRNQLTEGPNTNVLMYEYFYNGGGVAIGDLNNDGLDDIYFSGNMVSNALYLNKGNLKFEDITAKAGVQGREGPWTTGVSMADVNGDGWLDIYVCYSGNLPSDKRRNQLFIHQGLNDEGIPFFKEKAVEFGLDIDSYSTQALFFDYDLDGDLDMFLLNHNPKSIPVLDESSTKDLLSKKDASGSQLFRNDNGKFVEVTEEAGIQNSALSYGLGIGAADLNGNGYPDLYVSNDYTATDYLYFNNGNGTFSEGSKTSLGHISQFSMGNELADFNNDGFIDIFTLDMLPEDNKRQKLLMSPDNYEKHQFMVNAGLHYQYMRNMLHQNHGNGRFSEIGQIAGISNTDWSWAALFADFDNDGWKDLFVSNGYRKDYTNLDFLKYMSDYVQNHRGNLKRDNILDLVSNIPSSDISNYVFQNNQAGGFNNVTSEWGLYKPINSNGAAYADLDNDGDLELIINNIDATSFIYKNNSQETKQNNWIQIKLKGEGNNPDGIGAKVYIFNSNGIQLQEQMPTRGYQSSVSFKLHFGLGKINEIDSLMIIWPGGKYQNIKKPKINSLLILDQENSQEQAFLSLPKNNQAIFKNTGELGEPTLKSEFNDFKRQPLLPNPISGDKIALVKGDLNGDGFDDVFVGGLFGQAPQILFQNKNGDFTPKELRNLEETLDYEDVDAAIFDANGNGFLDIYVASGGYGNFIKGDKRFQDRLYLNDGNGGFVWSKNALPENYYPTTTVEFNDINGDGYPDLFVGSGAIPGQYPHSETSVILINNQDGSFKDMTSKYFPELADIGIVKDAKWVDLNRNGQKELILLGEWMPISIFALKDEKFENVTDQYFTHETTGWWNTIQLEEIDGKIVLIAGNYGLNSQIKANTKEPVELYFKDFDDNGSVDPILTTFIQGVSYPYLTRDEFLDQFIYKKSGFTTYESYANAKIEDLFTPNEFKDYGYRRALSLDTKMFVLDSKDIFEEVELPLEVQYSPVHKILFIEHVSNRYLLFFGNQENSKLRIGKQDANHGVLVKLNDLSKPEYIPQSISGFNIIGDSRNALRIGEKKIIVNIMGQALQVYEY
ncbi:VCBS repeat protein [Mongoliibacter ruber]|uniref:VCBS repeat protein n=2 Tax=Mongoliibacter ruber TaxID=1750599 RepID=A0A2T0WSD7_9BACT|nr:VCBS repeat protein [Mongoliibacter ruber]